MGPEEALRFARGEEVKSSLGEPAKLSRPLDWMALTDHSDAAGMIFEIRDGNPFLMANPTLKNWHDMMADGRGVEAAMEMIKAQSNNQRSRRDQGRQARDDHLAEKHRHLRKVQRTRPVHRVHRLSSGPATPAAATTCIAT